MTQSIWLNLPVKNVQQAAKFFTDIGFQPNPGPGNSEHSAGFLIGEQKITLMLFSEPQFAGFTKNGVSNTAEGTEVLFSLGVDSRKQVDEFCERVKSAGGEIFSPPAEANGFMYGFGFCDLDGHRWNVLYMDFSKAPTR